MATFRKIVQVSTGLFQPNPESAPDLAVIALCDDGSVWRSRDFGPWDRWDVSEITDSQADGGVEHADVP